MAPIYYSIYPIIQIGLKLVIKELCFNVWADTTKANHTDKANISHTPVKFHVAHQHF